MEWTSVNERLRFQSNRIDYSGLMIRKARQHQQRSINRHASRVVKWFMCFSCQAISIIISWKCDRMVICALVSLEGIFLFIFLFRLERNHLNQKSNLLILLQLISFNQTFILFMKFIVQCSICALVQNQIRPKRTCTFMLGELRYGFFPFLLLLAFQTSARTFVMYSILFSLRVMFFLIQLLTVWYFVRHRRSRQISR